MENMQREPFATLDAEEAIAFLIPARPYLERVAGYPDDGRETMTANVARMVERIKVEYPGAWKKSEPGCARVMVSAHDTGTYAANRTDPDVLEKAVFIASNADSTTSEDLRDIEEGGPGWRTLSSRFKTSKDVSAVCSLSYHLPRDAVAMRAMVPMTVGTPPPGTKIWATEDHRQVELSFSRKRPRDGARARLQIPSRSQPPRVGHRLRRTGQPTGLHGPDGQVAILPPRPRHSRAIPATHRG